MAVNTARLGLNNVSPHRLSGASGRSPRPAAPVPPRAERGRGGEHSPPQAVPGRPRAGRGYAWPRPVRPGIASVMISQVEY